MSTTVRETSFEPPITYAGPPRLAPRRVVSALWLFAILNYIYCDVFSSLDPVNLRAAVNGDGAGGIELTQGALLTAAVLMTIPMGSVLATRIAPFRFARWSAVGAGMVMTLAQVASLFVGGLTMYYAYFSAIEIATTATIVVIAWRWRAEA